MKHSKKTVRRWRIATCIIYAGTLAIIGALLALLLVSGLYITGISAVCPAIIWKPCTVTATVGALMVTIGSFVYNK